MPRRPRSSKQVSEEDRILFREAVAGVKPLPAGNDIVHESPRPPPVARSRLRDEREVIAELAAAIPDGDLETGEELSWRREGVQDSLMRKLRRGHYRIERELDLHGHTQAEAKPAVAVFLHEARLDGLGCVRIIHGKGRGSRTGQSVLKQRVAGWLRVHDGVLAYASARPVDGGTGAVLVLLRTLR